MNDYYGDGAPPPGDDAASRRDLLRDWTMDAAGLARIPPPVPLIEGWLNCDSLAWLVGEPGHCKSFVAQDMAGCISTGADWHGHAAKQAGVLYVVLEGAPGLNRRVRVWEDYYARATSVRFLVPQGRVHLITDADAIAELAAEIDAGLVIIDTQNRATTGLDENSNVDMGRMISAMEAIRWRTKACVLNVHHTSLGQRRPRGHSSIDGAADTMLRVAKDGGLVKVENPKQKDSGRPPVVLLNATAHEGGLVLASQNGSGLAVTDSERKALAELKTIVETRGPATHADWKRATTSNGMPESTFNWALRRLKERGLITREGSQGKWGLTDPTQGALTDPPANPKAEGDWRQQW